MSEKKVDGLPEEFRSLEKEDIRAMLDILSDISRPMADAAGCCMLGDAEGLQTIMTRELSCCDFDSPEEREKMLTTSIRRHRAAGRVFMQMADCLEKMK